MLVPALLALLACGSRLPERIEDCPDTTCREEWLLERYAQDPDEAAEALERVEDPVERVVLVTRLVETWPGRTRALCNKVAPGPARTRCERINGRPHLQSDPPKLESTGRPRAAGGPSTPDLPAPSPATSPYHGVEPVQGPCAQRQEPRVCYATQALRDVREDPRRAAAACAGLQDQKWVSECLFSAAEMLASSRRTEGLTAASDLCVAAVPFSSNCLAHLIIILARQSPDATERDPAAWAPLNHTADAIAAHWQQRYPEYVDLHLDRFWSEVMSLAYGNTPEVTGGPLEGVPERARRHVRAAAALRLMELQGVRAQPTIAAWIDAVEAALAARAEQTWRPPPLVQPKQRERGEENKQPQGAGMFLGKENFWREDLEGDEAWPATFYWGTGRRTWTDEVRQDLAICVLEAAAQMAFRAQQKGDKPALDHARALVREGMSSPEPAVRWTAERLWARALQG